VDRDFANVAEVEVAGGIDGDATDAAEEFRAEPGQLTQEVTVGGEDVDNFGS